MLELRLEFLHGRNYVCNGDVVRAPHSAAGNQNWTRPAHPLVFLNACQVGGTGAELSFVTVEIE
jgi:hypothetical protein